MKWQWTKLFLQSCGSRTCGQKFSNNKKARVSNKLVSVLEDRGMIRVGVA